MSEIPSKELRVLDAATDVFLRYGFGRTTMGDIAKRARISRPALYLWFPNKDAIFAAVIRRVDAEKLAKIRAGLGTRQTLSEKLLFACQDWGSHGVELTAAHPDAADLFDLRFEVVREVYSNFEALIASLVADAAEASGLAASPEEIARWVVYCMRGLRETAADAADQRRLIALQIQILIRALGLEPNAEPHECPRR